MSTTTIAVGQTLSETLSSLADADLTKLLETLAISSREIAALCRRGMSEKISSTNTFGDEQLALDVAADAVLMKALRNSGIVRVASSEETPTEVEMAPTGRFSVAFDPLDGSSIVACNWTVGTIIGIWESAKLVGVSGTEMVAAVVTVYGPRTSMFVALREGWGSQRVVEYTLREDGGWAVSLVPVGIGEGKLFSPANLRATQDNQGYRDLMELYMRERYTLRYTGGMVPDVTQTLVKGFGVFTSPVSEKARAKLRLLYEAMPMAFLIEAAGGKSSDGEKGLLERVVGSCDERTPVCLGSVQEVKRFEEYCGRKEEKTDG